MLKKIIDNKWFAVVSRLLVGAILVLGSALKLPDIKLNSVNVVYEYGILPLEPIDFAAIFGYILPFAELAVGLALIFGVLPRLASLGGGLLGLSFVIGEGIVLMQGRDINCGCFPGLMGTMVSQTIYLSAAIILFSLIVFFSRNRDFLSINRLIEKSSGLPKWIKALS
jgi:hypothetical protein